MAMNWDPPSLLAFHRQTFGDLRMQDERPSAPEATPSAPAAESVVVHTTESKPPTDQPAERTFTQADVDRMIADRVKRAKPADYDDLRKKADEFDKLQDAQKTEQERATEALQKAATQAEQEKARADAADARALRLEVAFEKGLTPAQAKRLVGGSREELEADAADILENFPVKTDGRPKGDADQGVRTVPAVKVVAPGMDTVRYAYDTASSTGS